LRVDEATDLMAVRVDPRWLSLAAFCCALSGCGAPVFPRELFTISGQGADYPVMLSRTPAPRGGRPIVASSGTHASQSSASYGNVTVTTTRSGQSELPAATKLHAQIGRNDRWVQIQGSTFRAVDFSTYGASSADRSLSIEGMSYR